MRWSWLAPVGVALACLPCLLALLVAAGIGTGALSAAGAALAQPGLAAAAAFVAVLLFTGAAVVFARRRAGAACEDEN